MPYQDSYVAKIREKVGHDFLLVMPTIDVVIKNAHDEFLMVYNKDFQGWTFPGGYVEPELSWQANAAREADEEGGIVANPLDFQVIGNASGDNYVAHYANGDTVKLYTTVFLVEKWQNEKPAIDETEIIAKKWISAADMATTNLTFSGKVVWEVYSQYQTTKQPVSLIN